jgi:diguanylate cyclase (GGDEF)-like protein
MPKVLIIGGGAGGSSLLSILNDDPEIDLVGVADINSKSPAMSKAKELGVHTSTDYHELLSRFDPDVIVNVTGSEGVSKDLQTSKKKGVEILEGLSAKLLFNLVDERQKREEEVVKSLEAQQVLYNIGLMLTSSEKEDELLNIIVEHATKLTETPAGSITLFNERDGAMEMVAAQGFSDGFEERVKWKVRKGGLTEHILNEGAIVVINDFAKYKKFDDHALAVEGIQSLMAVPLVAGRKTIGLLYVDDYKPRNFTKKDESILSLLATQAAAAIEKIQILEMAKKLAITDELTSLYNHRHFVNLFKDELIRSKRYKRNLSVILIDIDNFKNYNDTHGHLKGNDALRVVSSVMQKNLRDLDALARYGGEEFAVVLPETGKKEAMECAERIRYAIEKEPVFGEDKQPLGKVTASFGVATFPSDGDYEHILMDRADVALYKAKSSGRNMVIDCAKI